jgi:hypothetical protein
MEDFMRVIIRGNWGPYVGPDYCDVLGIYDSLEDAVQDAEDYAYDVWEPDEDSDFEDEGPEYWIEEYDQEKHDNLRAGGGSFLPEFEAIEKRLYYIA